MKKILSFFKLLFFSVFATTKMLENVEADWAKLVGENSSKPNPNPAAEGKSPNNQES